MESPFTWTKIYSRNRLKSGIFYASSQASGKIKNNKIQMRRAELGNFDYDIKHLPGKSNLAPDALSRACSIIPLAEDLSQLHNKLGHPGISRLSHFVRSKHLPFSTEDVKKVCTSCKICVELKPQFYRRPPEQLIKSLRLWDRISIDFKGPLSGKH